MKSMTWRMPCRSISPWIGITRGPGWAYTLQHRFGDRHRDVRGLRQRRGGARARFRIGDEALRGAERAHVAHHGVGVGGRPRAPGRRHRIDIGRHDVARAAEEPIAFRSREQVLRLAERHGVALPSAKAAEPARRAFDDPHLQIAFAQPMAREELAHGVRDAAAGIGQRDGAALEGLYTRDIGARDERVDRIVELRGDRHHVGAGEIGAHEKRRRDVHEVEGALVQVGDHAVGAAVERHHQAEIDAVGAKEALALRHGDRQRVDAPVGRRRLAVAHHDVLRRSDSRRK